MSETKHTPGPWVQGDGDPEHILSASTLVCVATVNPILSDREANARLIAAAPELLEACRIALPYLGDVLIADHPDYTAVHNAIAKAQGHAND